MCPWTAAAIHRAAGPELVEECRQFPLVESAPGVRPLVRCPTGEARITKYERRGQLARKRRIPDQQVLCLGDHVIFALHSPASDRGYDLPAKHVIHTVGPIYESEESSAPLLRRAYMWVWYSRALQASESGLGEV